MNCPFQVKFSKIGLELGLLGYLGFEIGLSGGFFLDFAFRLGGGKISSRFDQGLFTFGSIGFDIQGLSGFVRLAFNCLRLQVVNAFVKVDFIMQK